MQTVILKVVGMSCAGCTDTVTRALVAVDGVHNVNVSITLGEVEVDFDENMTSIESLKSSLLVSGYAVNENVD